MRTVATPTLATLTMAVLPRWRHFAVSLRYLVITPPRWRHFEWRELPPAELRDDARTLGGLRRTAREPFKAPRTPDPNLQPEPEPKPEPEPDPDLDP